MDVNAILLKPLDGAAPGTPRRLNKADFDRLRSMGAVREAGADEDTEAAPNEDALLLEQLRGPDGLKIVAGMKLSFEDLRRDRERLSDLVTTAERAAAEAELARDAAITDRDNAVADRDQARSANEAAQAEIVRLNAEIVSLKAAGERGAKSKTIG